MTPMKPDDIEEDEEESMVHHTLMFAPKSLVLISRLDYFDTLRVSFLCLIGISISSTYQWRNQDLPRWASCPPRGPN